MNDICAQLQRNRPPLPIVDDPVGYRRYVIATAGAIRQSNEAIFALSPRVFGPDEAVVKLFQGSVSDVDFIALLHRLDASARAHDDAGYHAVRAEIQDLAARTRLRAIQMGDYGLDSCRRAYDVTPPP